MDLAIATFNVNGIRARLEILSGWLASDGPDIVCLQETKVQDKDFPAEPLAQLGYTASYLGQKSYNGVAILSKAAPDQVILGRPGVDDPQARMISARFGDLWVINTYVPQGREPGHEYFLYKLEFLDWLGGWLKENFSPGERLIWTGDLNVAPSDRDLWDPVKLAGQVGCQPEERRALESITAWGLTDLFRLHHPEDRQFTFWDYRMRGALKHNQGWRIDHFFATRAVAKSCRACWVKEDLRRLPKPSDHTPLIAEFAQPG